MLHPEKTRIEDMTQPAEAGGFDFLRYHFERGWKWPRKTSLRKLKDTMQKHTRRTSGQSMERIVSKLNPVLRGWGNYFRTGNASKQFNSLDSFVASRLVRLIGQREGLEKRPFYRPDWPRLRFVHDFGLHRLLGTIRYPGGVHAT